MTEAVPPSHGQRRSNHVGLIRAGGGQAGWQVGTVKHADSQILADLTGGGQRKREQERS